MNKEDNIALNYHANIKETEVLLAALKSKILSVSIARLVVVLLACVLAYFIGFQFLNLFILFVLAAAFFLFLMKKHDKLFRERLYLENKMLFFSNELKALDYDYSAFAGGENYINPSHRFSFDLDLFGKKSFFQSLNRTVTEGGERRLADLLTKGEENINVIYSHQGVVKELTSKPSFLFHFYALGKTSETKKIDILTYLKDFRQHKKISQSYWRYCLYLPIVLVVILVLLHLFYTSIPSSFFLLFYLLLLFFSFLPSKYMSSKMSAFEKRVDELNQYVQLFSEIEKQTFESKGLQELQSHLQSPLSACKAIDQLTKISSRFGESQTIIGITLLNPFLLWNVRATMQMESWVDKYENALTSWMEQLSKFDSYVSLALYAYNHPAYVYPELTDEYQLEAAALGHPLVKKEVCVTNNVDIKKRPYFLVITGANMSGKSTYLRTVALSLVMAQVGLPVFASSFKCYPFKLMTDLRVSDSLMDNESYFFAELKRLKMIIDALQSGEKLFIILDEILKGTNSEDKQKGSLALMKQLVQNNGCGIIATHDLVLGELETEFPDSVKNYRFEADITNNELTFTYKIREGIAKNMNACFLMKKMGIIGL